MDNFCGRKVGPRGPKCLEAPCLLITLIKCLKDHKPLGLLFNVKIKRVWLMQWLSDKVTYWIVCGQLNMVLLAINSKIWKCFMDSTFFSYFCNSFHYSIILVIRKVPPPLPSPKVDKTKKLLYFKEKAILSILFFMNIFNFLV